MFLRCPRPPDSKPLLFVYVCVQTGVVGGLQQWDERQGPTPTSRSPHSWGHTGCGLMDKQMGAMRQVGVV